MLAKYVLPLALAAMLLAASLGYASGESRLALDLTHNSPLTFTPNTGQWDDQIHFRANTNGATIWFARDGVCYEFVRETSGTTTTSGEFDRQEKDIECLLIKATLLGANTEAGVSGEGLLGYKSNYFLGPDPGRWRTNVPSYEAIIYHDVYPGIDLRYYYNGRKMEYDFIVSPGADPSRIQVRYDGVQSVQINELDQLEITTPWGKVIESRPYIYQEDDSGRRAIAGTYRIVSDNAFGFEVDGSYNRETALIIDPVLLYSSYLGGTDSQTGYDIAIDSYGNIVVTGTTSSVDFPLVDPYQGSFAGTMDIFITKIDPAGSRVLYSTYFGGSDWERYPNIALDGQDNIYMCLTSWSDDLPTVQPLQSSLNGSCDVFILGLNSAGDQLRVATYLGGRTVEYSSAIAVDDQGMIYVIGETDSDDFPTANPFSSEISGGACDAFVTKMSATGDALIYSTYLGGRSDEATYDLLVNDAGEAYVVGATYSTDYPAVNNLYETKISKDGPTDAVITKFSAAGNTLEFSTFFGGTEDEWIKQIVFDLSGNLVLAGSVESDDFPTLNAYQTERCVGEDPSAAMAFVSVMTADNSELLSSTYLGGCLDDDLQGAVVTPDGSIWVYGSTYSTDFPIVDPIFGELDGAPGVFLTQLNSNASDVLFSTFYGGSNGDLAKAIATDANGWIYITGWTYSTDLPLVNPTQTTCTPYYKNDVFVAQLKGGCCIGSTGNIDADDNDVLNILDVDYAINWFFRHGPSPECQAEADADGNGRIDIEDVVYLVNYVFRTGPLPAICKD